MIGLTGSSRLWISHSLLPPNSVVMAGQKIKLLFLLFAISFLVLERTPEMMAMPQANQAQQDDDEFPLADEEGQINLADKADLNVEGFIRWLSRVKNIKIVNDGRLKDLANKLEFYGRTRVDVNVNEMFELAQAILRSNNLALVEGEIEGWHRIVPLAQTRVFAPETDPEQLQSLPKAQYVTAVFTLSNASPDSVSQYIQQLLYVGDDKTSTMSTVPGRKILIVTETAKKLIRIRDLINHLDQPVKLAEPVFHKVIHLSAEELATQLKDILSQTARVSTGDSNATDKIQAIPDLSISSNLRTNELILIGTPGQVEQAMKLIRKLDVGLGLELRRYQFQFVPATRVDGLVRQSLGTQDDTTVQRLYQSTVRADSNELIVTAGLEIHKRIEQIKKQLDVQSQEENVQSPIKFYTLKNVKAVDILDTLRAIERRFRENQRDSRRNPRLNGITGGVNFPSSGANGFVPANAGGFPQNPVQFNGNQFGNQSGNQVGNPDFQNPGEFGPGEAGTQVPTPQSRGSSASQSIIPGEAKITIDDTTNTLIVVAEPAVQELYKDLIEKLDVRRPQVLIEVNIVTLTDNEDFNLGIEVGGGDRAGSKRLFSFTSFGLSETSGTNGTLGLRPGLGFNGTLVDPEVADVVLRALSRHRKAKVIAAPRILVNDNATGLLSSVAEVAFTSINANNTISTTSFAGFAQAGTTISVIPQISDDDYLNLEFDVLVNDFTGPGSDGVPPPRNTDQVASEVSIPDGHTVIVGGLTRRRISEDVQGIPLIEELPILKDLTNRQIRTGEGQRLFVFIKPVILRDDKFKDLRFLSELERNRACLPDDFPFSSPVLIR